MRPSYLLPCLSGVLLLVGCGGSGRIGNAAQVRFFDAFRGIDNVRLYVGGRLYKSDGKSSFDFGDGFKYANAVSGSDLTLTVNPYGDVNTTNATLTAQTLVEGDHYTLIGVTTGSTSTGTGNTTSQSYTQNLRLFRDSIDQQADTQYLRVILATSTQTPVYLRLVRKSDNTLVYSSFTTSNGGVGLAVGNGTGYLAIQPSETSDAEEYTLRVYDAADFGNELVSATVSLQVDHPVTAILYNRNNTSTDLRIKSGEDTVD